MTLKRILLGIAGLAFIAAAVLFVLDRTIFAPVAVSNAVPTAPALAAQPQAATSSGELNTSAVNSANSNAQLYRIDATQSEVHYEVDETLFTQNNKLNTAIGRTKGVAGDLRIDFTDPAKSQLGTFVIDVSQLTSDESRRDNFIRHQGLQSSTYPTATFTTKSIDGLPAQVQVGQQINFKITGDLTVKTTTKSVTWDVTLTVNQDKLAGSAVANILLSDFGVGPFQLPILQTKDQAKLVFDFVALPVSS